MAFLNLGSELILGLGSHNSARASRGGIAGGTGGRRRNSRAVLSSVKENRVKKDLRGRERCLLIRKGLFGAPTVGACCRRSGIMVAQVGWCATGGWCIEREREEGLGLMKP